MNWRQAQTMHTGKAGSSWLSDDPQTLRDCFHRQPPLLYPIPPPTTPVGKFSDADGGVAWLKVIE